MEKNKDDSSNSDFNRRDFIKLGTAASIGAAIAGIALQGCIPLLFKHFLAIYGAENAREKLRFSADAMRRLMQVSWEGNVRELRNLVESLAVLAPRDEIRVEDLPEEYRGEPEDPPAPSTALPASGGEENLTMEEIERRAILGALEKTGGNRTRAAGLLGIGLRTLQRKLKEYRLAGKT